MTQPIAGIARNSCPLCGELTHVPVHRMLFRSWNDFPCSACKGRIIIAESTGMMALVGGLIGMSLGIWASFQILPSLRGTGPLPDPSRWYLGLVPVVLPFVAFVACAIPFARWSLKLVPLSGE